MNIPCSILVTGSDIVNRQLLNFCLLGLLLLGSPLLYAYETDQVTNRHQKINDSTEILNEQVNEALLELSRNWRGPRDEKRFISRVYHKIGGHHWVDRLERWAMNSEQVEKLDIGRYESIYSKHPITATRVTKFFGIGPTIKLNNHLVGSDKIGHFISQGKKFNYRWRKYMSRLPKKTYREQVRNLARYYCRTFNRYYRGDVKLATLTIDYHRERTLPDYQSPAYKVIRMLD